MPNPTQASEAGSGPSMNPASEPTLSPPEASTPALRKERLAAAGRALARRAAGAARKAPRWAWRGLCGCPRLFHHARNLTTDVLLALVLVGFAFVSWRTLTADDLSIHPFVVPEEHAKSGYTGEVAAVRLREALLTLADYQHSDALLYGGEFNLPIIPDLNRAAGIPNVEVHGVGLSFTQLVAQIRDALGLRTRRITGELVRRKDQLCLGVKFDSQPGRPEARRIVICSNDADRPDDLIERGAQIVLLEISPEFALRYPPRERSDEVSAHVNRLADRLGRSSKREDRALSYEISALNHRYRGNNLSYAIRELERAVALRPNSRRVVMLQTFRYYRDTDGIGAEIERAKASPDRQARLAALVDRLETVSKSNALAFDDAAEKHGVRDANSEALAGILHALIAHWMHRTGAAMTAPAEHARVVAVARRALAAGIERTARANRPLAFDHNVMVTAAALLGDRDAVRRMCRRIEELDATGPEVVRCFQIFYAWHRSKAADLKAAAEAYGNMLDRYVENFGFHLPRRQAASTPASLRDRIGGFRKRQTRHRYYRMLFEVLDADELRAVRELGLVTGNHESLLRASAHADHRLTLRRMTVWLLTEVECFVQTFEDDAALLAVVAVEFRRNELQESADRIAARATVARAAQSGRKDPDRTDEAPAADDARRKSEEELAAARKQSDDWRKLRCEQMMKWRAHATINRMPLGIAQ